MEIDALRQIPLADFLTRLGHEPIRRRGNEWWYAAPYRTERTPSFRVNVDKQLWYDFGLGKGGDIFTLAGEFVRSSDFMEQAKFITEADIVPLPQIEPRPHKTVEKKPVFEEMEIRPLSHRALLSYLEERGIAPAIAQRHCKEVHFQLYGKRYFAIAFPNGSCGYEIRNRYFKGCIAPKEISHIRQSGKARNTCYVFEGFMDYLSFLTLRQESCPNYPELDGQDYIVLNSVSNVNKALYPLGNYERIHCFFDNDHAGLEALRQIRMEYGRERYIRDASQIYRGCKDLNEYLQKQIERKRQLQSAKGVRSQSPEKKNGFQL